MADIRESEIKNRLKKEYFDAYDWTRVIGDIDLAVCSQPVIGTPQTTFLWMETKKGVRDYYESLIQLILTVGKARTFEKELPPYFLGAADAQSVVFVPYSEVMHIFTKTDFNWNVTPSDHGTKEFKELYSLLHDELSKQVLVFKYAFDSESMKKWIRKNFKEGRKAAAKMPVNKNNFTFVYYDWVKSVKPSISFDWDKYSKLGVLDCDFYLADLMSVGDVSLHEGLKVVLEKTKYKLSRQIDGDDLFSEFSFKDGMIAYHQFWNRYQRPPKPVYQKYILDRRDLLVPQNIREVKGSYYTPEIWVRKAQEYIEKVLGENWQEEYFVWDCAAGSGNLLRGLTNKYNIFASTLDDADVKIMHQAIDEGRLNLVKNNVFQFDFLNDDFSKCPEALQTILSDEDKRKKLVIFINPPYGEAGSRNTVSGTGKNKTDIAVSQRIYHKYSQIIGIAGRELYALFFTRVIKEIPNSILSAFSTLKMLTGPNFSDFRSVFQPRLKDGFIVPASTFDNISGNFPIGFLIWNLNEKEPFTEASVQAFDTDGSFIQNKVISSYSKERTINDWIIKTRHRSGHEFKLGFMSAKGCDFQNINYNFIINDKSQLPHPRGTWITSDNLIEISVYTAVIHTPKGTWLNDRDIFLHPCESWLLDIEFQVNCLIFTLFNNRISITKGTNHWIPYYESEVNSPSPFNSRFMADFIHGKIKRNVIVETTGDIFAESLAREAAKTAPIDILSPEARAVLDAGRELWKYYLSKPNVNPNASYYDIRWYFQDHKIDKNGKESLLPSSNDSLYMKLWSDIKDAIKALERVIEPKIYEHGFLKK